MKKLIALLMMVCLAVMPFDAFAEAAPEDAVVINWEDVSAMTEGVEGDFWYNEDLGLKFWLPTGFQEIEFTHAEILKSDGSLNRALLRSAKAHALYIAKAGKQTYEPRMSYMGFRYVGVTGIEEKDIELYAYARFSDIEQTGDWELTVKLKEPSATWQYVLGTTAGHVVSKAYCEAHAEDFGSADQVYVERNGVRIGYADLVKEVEHE